VYSSVPPTGAPPLTLQTAHPAAEFSWRAHPAAERSGHAALGAAVILGLAGCAYALTGSAAWGALAVVVLAASLSRFYFPSRYEIDEAGITARSLLSTRRLRWENVRRFVTDRHGGYLSPRAARSVLDPWRGMHVLFGAQRDAVVERIRAHLRREGEP
jgi:hypothetical protein